jgi:hypothetical protein
MSLLHEVGDQLLGVDLKGGLQTLTNFTRLKSQAKSFRATPSHLGFPTNPRVTRENSMKSRDNKICLGGNVDRDLLLPTRGILKLWCFNNGGRE